MGVIFESPDGGKTIRARQFGDITDSSELDADNIKPLHKYLDWVDMMELSKEHKSLQEALDHVIMIYNLVKKTK